MLQFSFETVNEALPELCDAVMNTGTVVSSRLGEKTKELRNVSVALTNPRAREVYVPGRRASYPAQIIETMWVLSGRNDVAALLPYLPRAADYSDNGKTWRGAYGPRLRAWGTHKPPHGPGFDQLAHVAASHRPSDERGRPVIAVQIVKRITPVVLTPALELPARERRLKLAHRLAEREREDVPEPQLPALAQAFPACSR